MHEQQHELTPLTHPLRPNLRVDQSAHFSAAVSIVVGYGVTGAAAIAEQPGIDANVARQLRALLALTPEQRAAIASRFLRVPSRETRAVLEARRQGIAEEFESRGALLPRRSRR